MGVCRPDDNEKKEKKEHRGDASSTSGGPYKGSKQREKKRDEKNSPPAVVAAVKEGEKEKHNMHRASTRLGISRARQCATGGSTSVLCPTRDRTRALSPRNTSDDGDAGKQKDDSAVRQEGAVFW